MNVEQRNNRRNLKNKEEKIFSNYLNYINKQYILKKSSSISLEKEIKRMKANDKFKKYIYIKDNKRFSTSNTMDKENIKNENFLVNKYKKFKNIDKNIKKEELDNLKKNKFGISQGINTSDFVKKLNFTKNNMYPKNNSNVKLKLENDNIIKKEKNSNEIKSIITNNNFTNAFRLKENKFHKNKITENRKLIKIIPKDHLINNNISANVNIIKNNNKRYGKIGIMIKYFIIDILLCHVSNISSMFNKRMIKVLNIIAFYSYEITLKVKGSGIQKILSTSPSYIYSCPSYVYLNNELITQKIMDCQYMNLTESDSEIKLIWNNIDIVSTKGMFFDCSEITEIDMTKFDTSLVTDMSFMFAYCSSLKYLNVSNFDTTKVKTFENMFVQCTSLLSINLESFTNPSATSLYRMFYDCINLEYINLKNFEEKENLNIDEMFYNIPQNAVICLLSCPPPTNFTISEISTSEVIISWEGYEFNKFIISYSSQNLLNPENGNIINGVDKTNYTFTNLNSNERYNIYIKTDCEITSSD